MVELGQRQVLHEMPAFSIIIGNVHPAVVPFDKVGGVRGIDPHGMVVGMNTIVGSPAYRTPEKAEYPVYLACQNLGIETGLGYSRSNCAKMLQDRGHAMAPRQSGRLYKPPYYVQNMLYPWQRDAHARSRCWRLEAMG